MDPEDVKTDDASQSALLDEICGFRAASLAGEYYQDFAVNSQNYRDKSQGTQRWIAQCDRLLERCVEAAETGATGETRAAFELIFDLLLQIDSARLHIVFFADEAGSWQVGVNWGDVMPAWFRCVAATADPDEYATQVVAMICYFAHYEAERLLPEAHRFANDEQRAALARLPTPKRTYTRPTLGGSAG